MKKVLGRNLLFLRKSKGWQQSEIYTAIGIKASTWGNYENFVSQPNLDVLILISKYFGITESELLHEDLSLKGNLNIKNYDTKFDKNSNLNRNLLGNLIDENKEFKQRKNAIIPEFNPSLNEPQMPYSINEKIEDLYSKIAILAQSLSRIEDKITQSKGTSGKK